jgi:hypothetical protein
MRFLGLAYGSTDFTVVYPLARALPVLIVAAVDMLFRQRYPSGPGWVGMSLVVVGCVLAPQRSYRDLSARHYSGRALVWILLTAMSIVGFTMLDKMAAEIVRQGPGSAAIHCGVYHIFCAVGYLALGFIGRRPVSSSGATRWGLPLTAAVMGYLTYSMVLWAFQMDPRTGYLLAFRQFSILIGVIAAFRMYGEEGLAIRIPASCIIVVGLVVLAVWG